MNSPSFSTHITILYYIGYFALALPTGIGIGTFLGMKKIN
jgi:hypothetical protein